MTIKGAAAAVGAFIIMASPVWAVTVTNQAVKDHTLTVDFGEKENDYKLRAGASMKVDCSDGCALRLRSGPAGYDRMADSGDQLVINQDGFLLYADEGLMTGSLKGQPNGNVQKGTDKSRN